MSQLILPGTAGPGDVSNLKTFSSGIYYNAQGQLVDRRGTGVVITPGPSDIPITAGIYGGVVADGKVAAVPVNPAHVLAGDTIAGTAGTMPNHTFATNNNNYTSAVGHLTDGSGNLCLVPPTGYYLNETNGGGFGELLINDPNFIASNIPNWLSIFGLQGTGAFKHYATGSGTTNSSGIYQVSGLGFNPTLCYFSKGGSWFAGGITGANSTQVGGTTFCSFEFLTGGLYFGPTASSTAITWYAFG
ncbi:hypothetical protein DEAC_c16920 [Desulfosporosinus acididurans]|uniref:Uncharacterized protein n=1 Tax=Desulfosporosinus acididurans TaxID=476652 RepID=A0A0J1FTH1_9FIRM|nr:hypothetical protein [Desulfosporosinus acididurans]KLU66293.1 hypothetical protein DEAC_c16920 [Desulfosporosinus acididurans]